MDASPKSLESRIPGRLIFPPPPQREVGVGLGVSASCFHTIRPRFKPWTRLSQPFIPSVDRKMSTKLAWELKTGGWRQTDLLTGTSAHAPQCPRSRTLSCA
ncbi:hypothetical protein TNCV_3558201 [Trichonephila clavipes]|uniref:Uncharacterized protein n=1 Tax=Trichonephila clavipes TaxID=2585209 RepID=A0A8X7BJ44_TRICX|nr:hypothetical protein TNCV_3558201 [Trichonephila clavipes]